MRANGVSTRVRDRLFENPCPCNYHGPSQKLHLVFKIQRPEEGEGWWGTENSELSGLAAGLILFHTSDAKCRSGKEMPTALCPKGTPRGPLE